MKLSFKGKVRGFMLKNINFYKKQVAFLNKSFYTINNCVNYCELEYSDIPKLWIGTFIAHFFLVLQNCKKQTIQKIKKL